MRFDRAIRLAAIAMTLLSALVLGSVMVGLQVDGGIGALFGRKQGYRVGEFVDVDPSLYRERPYTLLVFERSGCVACEQAKPFLMTLTKSLAALGTPGLVLTNRAAPDDVAFADFLGIRAESVRTFRPGSLRLKGFPTVIIVDRRGQIGFSVAGAPPSADQDRLLGEARASAAR